MSSATPKPQVIVFDDEASLLAALPLEAREVHFPVVIVGGGACGLSAALHLHDLGIDALVLERDLVPSGSSALSSGFIPAAGTLAQKALGLEDSPEAFARDIQDKAHGLAAPHLVSAYTQSIAKALDALSQNHGFEWDVLTHFLYPGHAQYRMHTLPQRTGQALMDQLQRACQEAQISLLTQAHVLELWVLKGSQKVMAIAYQRPDQSMEWVRMDALFLACNGFGGNAQLVQEHIPQMKDAIYAGHVGNDGSALLWGKGLQAQTGDLGAFQGHGSWAKSQGVLVTWALMMEGAIQVNQEGRRFHNETGGYSEASVEVLSQPQGVAFNVFDEALLNLGRTFPDFQALEKMGGVKRFESSEALANWIGCAPSVLQTSLESLQPPVKSHGEEVTEHSLQQPVFERTFDRAFVGPLYAIEVTGALFHTQGGLEIDGTCRVQIQSQVSLPNLWAGGGAARGVSGPEVWGYLSGNGLLSAMASAFIAAQAIHAQLSSAP